MTQETKALIAIEAAAATVAEKLVNSGMTQDEVKDYVSSHMDEIIEFAVRLIQSNKF